MDIIVSKLLGFAIVLTRISVFLMVVPIFNSQVVTARVRFSIVLMVSLCLATAMPAVVNIHELSALSSVLMILSEAVYGFGLGLIVVLIFSAVKVGGRIIEREMGLAMAEMLDPLSGESVEPLSILIEMVFILFFLAADGHHLLLLVISKSYEAFPAGRIPDLAALTEGIVTAGSTMLTAGLRLAAPMLAAFLLLLAVLGVFARILPEMDILFISMPLRVGLGLMMVGVFFPLIHQFINEFSDWMGKLLPM